MQQVEIFSAYWEGNENNDPFPALQDDLNHWLSNNDTVDIINVFPVGGGDEYAGKFALIVLYRLNTEK